MGFGSFAGAALGLGSSLLGSKEQGKAAGVSQEALNKYGKESREDFLKYSDVAMEKTDPWAEAGASALDVYKKAVLEGDYSAFNTSPGYQFRQDEAQKGVERSAAARGGALSGNAVKGITEYSQNIASGEYTNWLNPVYGLSNQGLSASENQASRSMDLARSLDDVGYTVATGTSKNAEAQGQIASNKYNDFGSFLGNVDWKDMGTSISKLF